MAENFEKRQNVKQSEGASLDQDSAMKTSEIEDQDEELDSSSDSDVSDDAEMEDDGRISDLQKTVETNPYHYDSHLELIKELRSLGDLEKLRKGREKMAEIFPLTEELWSEWLNDEMPLVVVPGHKEYIISLFEKAVQDYLSVRIWLQYCQFVMDGIESSTAIDAVRKIFERAITAVGIHLTQGSSVWDSYREFEMALLESMQANQEDSDDDKIDAQIQRVEGIYRRQLAVPLHDMDSTKEEYEDWTSEPIPDNIIKAFEKAMIKYEQCMQFENKLASASSPKLAEYQDYISFEMKDGDPARIQCIFERAITENCLNANLWQQYTQYLDHKLKVPAVAVKVHARAVRNCPWVSSLWVDYLKALARNNSSSSDIKDVFQKALGCGFSSGEEYQQLWLTNCDYTKGRITDWEADTVEVEELRKTFDEAITYMDHYFGNDGDKSSLIRRYWAAVEAKYLKNLTKAQELWDSIIKVHSKETHTWLEYTHFLRLYGDVVSCRRAFQRAVQTTVDDPEKLCEAFLNFERIEGTFSQLESAVEKTKNLRTRIDTKRLKEAEEQAEKLKANVEKEERRKQAKLQKNRENKKLGKQQKNKDKQTRIGKGDVSKKERIEKEQNVMERSTKQTKETTKQSDEMHQEEKQEVGEPPSKKARVDATDEKQRENQDVGMEIAEELHEDRKAHNEATMKQTVFLSNLLFTVDEEAIKSKFKDVGDINEIRIVRNLVGRSKGFAYLEFKDESSVTKALQMDRELLNGRPVFVSQCVDKSKNQPQQFRYKLSLDKQTVFVTNLPFDSTREEIEELFKTAGEIKEVRIVTNRAGKPKGYAYVEFLNESSAASAVLNLDKHMMKEREINVALSKPPARRQNEKGQVDPRMEHKSLPQGSRGRARTQLAMVPRSIHTQPSSKQTQSAKQNENKGNADKNASDKPQGKMTNADFSKMFAK